MSTEIVEQWLPIKGYEGRYLISNYGNVKSIIYKNHYLLKKQFNKSGYQYVNLYSAQKQMKSKPISRLVGFAFIPNPNHYPQINHIKGIKTDNRVSQLEWCTQQQNNKHAIDTGLTSTTHLRKTKQEYELISDFLKSDKNTNTKKVINTLTGNRFHSIRKASDNTGIKYSALWDMLNGRRTNTTNLKLI